jgi:hypothetical protein
VALGVATVAGLAGHAILTNVRKMREIKNIPEAASETKTINE